MNKYIPLLAIAIVVLLVLFKDNAEHKKVVIHTVPTEQIVEIDEIEAKKIVEPENAKEAVSTNDSITSETVEQDEVWEENIKTHLLRQALDENLQIDIVKEKTVTLEEFGRPIKADSVKINLRNPAGESSSFRALVDHHTGKILRTWDRPVFDPVNPREIRGIKVNPLYHPYD